jgi:nitroreductase
MELDYCINNRKSIRKFKSGNISMEDLHTIIECAMLAPSAKNRQPWRFYILSNTQKKNIVNMMYAWEKTNRNEKTSVKGSANQIDMASAGIMIYKDKSKYIEYNRPDWLGIGAAIENMALKAVDLGLGSCWICDTLYMEDEINKYLKISKYEQIAMLAIGYPAETPERRKRLKKDDIIIN